MTYSRTKLSLLCLFTGLLLFVGCGERWSAKKEYAQFKRACITFPETMTKIENGNLEEVRFERSARPILVKYYGPEECSTCAVAHMQDNIKFMTLAQREGGFDFIVILAPPAEERALVVEKARLMSLPLTIYIDDSYHFEHLGVIPQNTAMHFFLLDMKGKPVFVGSPLSDESKRSIFQTMIRRMS